jgi:hypothetical protein
MPMWLCSILVVDVGDSVYLSPVFYYIYSAFVGVLIFAIKMHGENNLKLLVMDSFYTNVTGLTYCKKVMCSQEC